MTANVNASLWAFRIWLDTELTSTGATQADLARCLGVANYVVNNWRKRRRPGVGNCARLAAALGAPVNRVRGLVGLLPIDGGDVAPGEPQILTWMEQQRDVMPQVSFCEGCYTRIRSNGSRCPDCERRLATCKARRRAGMGWLFLTGDCYDATGEPHV